MTNTRITSKYVCDVCVAWVVVAWNTYIFRFYDFVFDFIAEKPDNLKLMLDWSAQGISYTSSQFDDVNSIEKNGWHVSMHSSYTKNEKIPAHRWQISINNQAIAM